MAKATATVILGLVAIVVAFALFGNPLFFIPVTQNACTSTTSMYEGESWKLTRCPADDRLTSTTAASDGITLHSRTFAPAQQGIERNVEVRGEVQPATNTEYEISYDIKGTPKASGGGEVWVLAAINGAPILNVQMAWQDLDRQGTQTISVPRGTKLEVKLSSQLEALPFATAEGTVTIKEVTTAQVCPADTFRCEDGSYVSRSGSNCQFAECSAITPPFQPLGIFARIGEFIASLFSQLFGLFR